MAFVFSTMSKACKLLWLSLVMLVQLITMVEIKLPRWQIYSRRVEIKGLEEKSTALVHEETIKLLYFQFTIFVDVRVI